MLNMLVKDFIQGPLISEIRSMTIVEDGTHAYLGFVLICQAIEFLGACLDPYSWEELGQSKNRFRLAIDHLFPDNYKRFNSQGEHDLYSNLRCSLVHSMQPASKIGLSERRHEKNGEKYHLQVVNGYLILIYEDFLQDFLEACREVIRRIESRGIVSGKVYAHVISIPKRF